jgi:hypothetical protein
MEEEAVATESGEEVVDGGGGAAEDPGDLSVGGTADGVLVDVDEELWSFEPVGGGEGLGGEGPAAGPAAESLDGVGRFESGEGAELLEGPGVGLGVVETAGGVWAEGRGRRAWRWGLSAHDGSRARTGPVNSLLGTSF